MDVRIVMRTYKRYDEGQDRKTGLKMKNAKVNGEIMRHSICILVLCMCTSFLLGQTHAWQGNRWMCFLEDDMEVSAMSIPGAHDAATGDGLCVNIGLGKTQHLSISEQWDCGVRAFDLRPALCDTVLHIYHSTLRTKISFHEAIDVILSKLSTNPSEFAIVLIRHESESEDDEEKSNWSSFIGAYIHSLGNHAVVFHPHLTLGEVRGKILFLTRNSYSGTDKGAMLTGWNHSAEGTNNARITSYYDASFATLQMQDYYAPTNKEKRLQKIQVVSRMLDVAQGAGRGVWTINFLSGYSSTFLGTAATTLGYKCNATWLHSQVLDIVMSNTVPRSYGIVFMDFVGVDKVRGGMSHWCPFEVNGSKLLNAIIASNF